MGSFWLYRAGVALGICIACYCNPEHLNSSNRSIMYTFLLTPVPIRPIRTYHNPKCASKVYAINSPAHASRTPHFHHGALKLLPFPYHWRNETLSKR